jgi:DMSO/TMAO reductase YedYZ molybdopterin-dependent catalytic subunit
MNFASRNREEQAAAGIDPARVPPGQYVTDRFPVLHAGVTPSIDLASWDFSIEGLVLDPAKLSLDEIKAKPTTELTYDIHCVTKWSKLDTTWTGVTVADFLDDVEVNPGATHVVVLAEHGFTANLPIEYFTAEHNLFSWQFDGEELELEHGWPLRLVVPHLYFWKSVKWVRGIRFVAEDEPGFWERNGYHMYGDPWKEQRYWGD